MNFTLNEPLLASFLLVAVATSTVSAPTAAPAATADSILANKRATDANGCRRVYKCVAWEKGAPGTFVGKCRRYKAERACPIVVK